MEKPDTKATLLKFNLNYSVFVKLTNEGYEYWKKKNDNLFSQVPEWIKEENYYKNKTDKNGFIKFQMWEFMQIFGDSIVFGCQPKFLINVFFYEAELEKDSR